MPKTILGLVNGNWLRSIDFDRILGFYIRFNSYLQNRLVGRDVSLYRPYLYSMCVTSYKEIVLVSNITIGTHFTKITVIDLPYVFQLVKAYQQQIEESQSLQEL